MNLDGPSNGRKHVDANVNMVPMIDLLVSTIAFLLMTAVWVHSGSVAATQPRPASDAPAPIVEPNDRIVRVAISPTGYRVGTTVADAREIAAGPMALSQLRDELRTRRMADPQLRDVFLSPDSVVSFDEVTRVMDSVNDVWTPARGAYADAVALHFD